MLRRRRILLSFQLLSSRLCDPVPVCCNRITEKRFDHTYTGVNHKMRKMITRKSFQNKLSQISDISLLESDEPDRYQPKLKTGKVNSKSSEFRNKTVGNLIKNEIQVSCLYPPGVLGGISRLVDSGDVGEDIQLLNLTFSGANLVSFNKCQIFWEPFMSPKDLEVAETLNKLAAKFRHLLTTNLIMNNVPQLQFSMNEESYRIAIVDEVLRNQTLDIGDPLDDPVEESASDRKVEVDRNHVYGLDREAILNRLGTLPNVKTYDET